MKKMGVPLIALMFILVMAAVGVERVGATIVTLTDLNSTVRIVTDTSAGMDTWSVDGVDQIFQQSFWFRVGQTGGESNISTLSVSDAFTTNFLASTYTGTGLQISVSYLLTGGTTGSNQSDVAETIRIINTGSSSLDFHFFQYNDFDLGGPGGDTVLRANANTMDQYDPTSIFTEVVGTPAPNSYQIGPFSTIRNLLNDGNPTTLSGGGPFTGDATWAWQWDFAIAPGGSIIISKDKNIRPIVPEPGTLLLLGSGLLGLVVVGRKKFRK